MPTTVDKEFKGAAVVTATTNTINSSDTAVSIADATGWPTGAQPFTAVIAKGTATEEKVLVASRSGLGLTITTRGYDNTTAASHTAGASIEHCVAAIDFDALFRHATDAGIDDHTQYLKVTTAASTYAPLTKLPTIASNTVATNQSTTSLSPVDLATAGPAIAVTVPASGVVKVTLSASLALDVANGYAIMYFAMSGANTAAADAARTVQYSGTYTASTSAQANVFHITGLTPGSTTFTAKYATTTGATAYFSKRSIIVETYP